MVLNGRVIIVNRTIFNADLHNEQVLGAYLDEYFYPRTNIKQFLREHDMPHQRVGIDVRFNANNQEFLVDEKGYLSRETIQDTFVLELSFKDPRGNRVEGWFYSPDKQTTHYLLCWADRDNINIYRDRLKVDNLHRVELMLVDRAVLQNYLSEKYGINRQYIKENQKDLYDKLQKSPINLPKSESRYMLSNQLREEPINIVMPKEEYLKSNAVLARYMVYRDRIEDLLKKTS